MRIGNIQEIENLTSIRLKEQLEGKPPIQHSATFCLPKAAGRLTAISREISLAINEVGGSVLIIGNTGVWPSSENRYLVETFRRAFGETRSIREAPLHVFGTDDQQNCWSLLSLCFFNAWDFSLASADGRILIRGSHDEYLDVYTVTSEDLQGVRSLMERFDIRAQEPGVRRELMVRHQQGMKDGLSSLYELRQLTSSDSTDTKTRERLAIALYELVIDSQETENLTFLGELRQLASAYPPDTPVREQYAKAVDSTLCFVAQAAKLELADALLEELRQLVRDHPEHVALRGIFARALVRASELARRENSPSKHDSWMKELQQFGESYPADSEVQQWLATTR
ncbi:MAG TPA: hypothetical protein VKY85_20315 [Candidatus Angelobacter sp.]|nr:hypothetical protein [Candidatus Angelobacter sp.]